MIIICFLASCIIAGASCAFILALYLSSTK